MKLKRIRKIVASVLTIAMILGMTMFVAAEANTTDNLVARFEFENNLNSSAGDLVGEERVTVGASNAVTYVPGANGSALSLSGDGYVEIPYDNADMDSVNYTISLWAKYSDFSKFYDVDVAAHYLTEDDKLAWAISGGYNGAPRAFYRYYTSEEKDINYGTDYYTKTSAVLTESNEWNLYTVTFDSTTVNIYINGVLAFSDNLTSQENNGIVVGNGKIMLGWSGNNSMEKFVGQIDDFRLYSRTLAQSDVAELYNEHAANIAVTPGLVAHYKFDSDATDSSSKGNNGTLVNSAEGITFEKGKLGNAAKFNGSSYIEIPYSETMNFEKAFTIMYWVKAETPTTDMPVFQQTGYQGEKGTGVVSVNSNAWAQFRSLQTNNTEKDYWTFSSLYSDLHEMSNTWYHVAIVYDGTKVSQYLNGALKKNTENEFDIHNPESVTLIGKDTGDNFFTGYLDEMRVYNQVVSSADIYQAYLNVDADPNVTSDPSASPSATPEVTPGPGGSSSGGSGTTAEKSIKFKKKSVKIKKGKKTTLKVTIKGAKKATFSVNKKGKKIVKLSKKKAKSVVVKGKKKGKATITAKAAGKKAICKVTVK